jgi:hypothetical protein
LRAGRLVLIPTCPARDSLLELSTMQKKGNDAIPTPAETHIYADI